MLKTRPKNPTRQRRLAMENLETREVLAGNVAVSLTNGTLRVIGDNNANVISIIQQPNGRFNVVGLDDETITGPTTNLLVRNLHVELRGGDDTVTIGGVGANEASVPAQILGRTKVYGGNGSDTLNVSVIGRLVGQYPLPALELVIEGDDLMTQYTRNIPQDDIVSVLDSAAATVTINTQAGDDFIDLINVLTLTSNINAGVLVPLNGATDADFVGINGFTAATATVNVGAGAAGAGGNVVSINSALTGLLSVTGWEGSETIVMNDVLAALSLSIYTYGGNDTVQLAGVQTGLTQNDYQTLVDTIIDAFDIEISVLPFDISQLIAFIPALPGTLSIYTGSGNDSVTVDDILSTSWIWIFLENGNDSLIATNVESNYAFFNGGAGTDGRFVSNVDADLLQVLLFETTLPNPGVGD